MKLLKFEIKKIWRQKKIAWLFLIIFLCILGIFQYNLAQENIRTERASEKLLVFLGEVNQLQGDFIILKREKQLDEIKEKQLEYVNDMNTALTHWKVAINNYKWDEIPQHEHDFLSHLTKFIELGGEFNSLQGAERDLAIQKNEWMVKYKLSYDDEEYPLSPALVLKQSSGILFSVLAIMILLFFFGSTITTEKEQNTWSTIKTQPISKQKRLMAKYSSLIMMLFVYILLVSGIGLLYPYLFGDYPINLMYPQIVSEGESYTIISTFQYLVKTVILLICACLFAFSLILFISVLFRSSFSTLMVTVFTIFIGYLVTVNYELLQSPANPFYYFCLTQLVGETTQNITWISLLSSCIWSLLLFLTAIFIPEKNFDFIQTKDNLKSFNNGDVNKKPSILWNLSIFEWRKIQRRGLFNQAIILLVLLISIGYFFTYQESREKENDYLSKLTNVKQEDDTIAMFESYLNSLEEARGSLEDESNAKYMDADIESYKRSIEFFNERKAKKTEAFQSYKRGEWTSFYEYQLFENRYANRELDTGALIVDIIDTYGRLTVSASIEEKKWLLRHNLEPIFSGEFIPTIYQYWGNDQVLEEKNWSEANRKVDSSGLYTLYLYFNQYLYFIPIVLFLFLFGGGLTTENGKKSTIRYLLTQPLTLRPIYHGKLLVSIAVSILSSIGIFLLVILLGTIFDRIGDWKYPILKYDSASLAHSANYTGFLSEGKGFHFIPLGEYLVQSIVLFLLVLLFFISLTTFCSLFIKNTFSVFTFVVIFAGIGYVISTQVFTEVAHYSPFTYMNIAKITNGEVSTMLDNSGINFTMGTLVLSISAIIWTLIGTISSKNKG